MEIEHWIAAQHITVGGQILHQRLQRPGEFLRLAGSEIPGEEAHRLVRADRLTTNPGVQVVERADRVERRQHIRAIRRSHRDHIAESETGQVTAAEIEKRPAGR